MTKKTLTITGWIAVIYAASYIPTIVLAVFAQDLAGVSGGKFIEAMVYIISIALYICLFLRLKQFLNECFGFHETDTLIKAMIIVNTVVVGINVIAIIAEFLQPLSLGLSVIALIGVGIIGIVFAIKLLRLPDELYGLLKPYAYTCMATSALTATIVLVPLALVVGVVNLIILAMILFRAAEQSITATA